jgi:hypothetical protein
MSGVGIGLIASSISSIDQHLSTLVAFCAGFFTVGIWRVSLIVFGPVMFLMYVLAGVLKCSLIGTVADLPTRRDAELILSNKLRHLNSTNHHPRSCCSLRDFVEEWKTQALPALKYASRQHYQ